MIFPLSQARRQTVLFVVCAAVLLAAGFAWGYAHAMTQLNAPQVLLQREIIDLDFNTRLLQRFVAKQPVILKDTLENRLNQQAVLVGQLAAACPPGADRAEAQQALDRLAKTRAGLGGGSAPASTP